MVGQNTDPESLSAGPGIATEMECKNIRVHIFNGSDPVVIQNTLQCLGSMFHAW